MKRIIAVFVICLFVASFGSRFKPTRQTHFYGDSVSVSKLNLTVDQIYGIMDAQGSYLDSVVTAQDTSRTSGTSITLYLPFKYAGQYTYGIQVTPQADSRMWAVPLSDSSITVTSSGTDIKFFWETKGRVR